MRKAVWQVQCHPQGLLKGGWGLGLGSCVHGNCCIIDTGLGVEEQEQLLVAGKGQDTEPWSQKAYDFDLV